MHIMEGYLPPAYCAVWVAAAAPAVVQSVRSTRKTIAEKRSSLLLLGAAGGFCFVLSALKLPSVTGSSSHPTGIGLGAILFGPWVMVLIGLIVLIFQALLLGHGGITTLGANVFSMAIVGSFVAYAVYRLARRSGLSLPLAALLAATLSDLATYLTTSIQLAWAFPDSVSGFLGSLAKFAGVFAVTQVPLAIVEGVLTMLVIQSLLSHGRADLEATGLLDDGAPPTVAFGRAALAGGLTFLVLVAATTLLSTGVLGFAGAGILMECLADAGIPRPRLAREQALATNVAPWVVRFERKRRAGARLVIEQEGAHSFAAPAGRFTVTAKADRIELRGLAADVLDFKTGQAPSARQVQSGLSPQLTLTAAILRNGGFAEIGAVEFGRVDLRAGQRGPHSRPRGDPRWARRKRGAGRAGAGRPDAARRRLRRCVDALHRLGRAAVHRPLGRRLRPPRPALGMGRDRRRGRRVPGMTPRRHAGRRHGPGHRLQSGRLGVRHRQRRLGQDQDPGRPRGAPAADRRQARGDSLRHLHQGRRGRDAAAPVQRSWAAGR